MEHYLVPNNSIIIYVLMWYSIKIREIENKQYKKCILMILTEYVVL